VFGGAANTQKKPLFSVLLSQITPKLRYTCAMEQKPTEEASFLTDETLMSRYMRGENQAFNSLYTRHKPALLGFIGHLCAGKLPHERIEEIFQEVWLNLIQGAERYVPSINGASFRTYLYTLAHRRVVDGFRAAGATAKIMSDVQAWDGDDVNSDFGANLAQGIASRVDEPDTRAAAQQQGVAIMEALAALPAPQREAFLLSEDAGLSVEAIAQATNVNVETAKSRLRYAVAKLRDALKDYL
jgi:RNA polymerase sigma-70 factor, ECF subfamily